MKETNNKIYNFYQNTKYTIIFSTITLFSLIIRILLLNKVSEDYTFFISRWFDILKENGGLKALSIDIGDYNAPYITILALLTYIPLKSLISVKLVSIIFDYVCALAVMQIVYILMER